jgi:DNA-binding response OmpR family regulator
VVRCLIPEVPAATICTRAGRLADTSGPERMSQRPVILVSDPQPASARLLCRVLAEEGFAPEAVGDLPLTADRAWTINPDIVVLDSDGDGDVALETMRDIHARQAVPVILVGGGSVHEICRGLDAGASDYIVRPFRAAELAARIRSIIRRRRHLIEGRRRVGDSTVDLDHGRLVVDGSLVEIARKEWLILEQLIAAEGRVEWHDELLSRVFGPGYVGDTAFLRVWIARLRRHLGVEAWDEGPIRTVDGVGYALDPGGRIPRGRSRRPRRPNVRREASANRSLGA